MQSGQDQHDDRIVPQVNIVAVFAKPCCLCRKRQIMKQGFVVLKKEDHKGKENADQKHAARDREAVHFRIPAGIIGK